MASRFWLVAATTRTSTVSVSLPAHALKLALLQHAQDLGLRGRRHVPHLVEEDRPAVALLELADPAVLGAGEGPLLVPEQLALEQAFGNRRAVDRQEGALVAAAVEVDRAGDQLLARAALAQDQDVDVLRGDAADLFADRLHGRAAADETVRRVGDLLRRIDGGRDVHQLADFQACSTTRFNWSRSSGFTR